jgi:hypothetical protein
VNTLTIDLDSLTQESAERFCTILMVVVGNFEKEETAPAPPNPATIFGSAAPPAVSSLGPALVIGSESQAPPPPPPQQAAPPAPPVQQSLDKSGLPWDARIHAASRAINADGAWKLKRGVDKTEVDHVTAELKQVMSIPSPGPQLVAAAAPPPPTPGPGAPPPPPSLGDESDLQDKFIKLFGRVNQAMNTGKLSEEQLAKCLAAIGAPSLPLLGARLDLVETASQLIDAIIAGQSA